MNFMTGLYFRFTFMALDDFISILPGDPVFTSTLALAPKFGGFPLISSSRVFVFARAAGTQGDGHR